MVCSLFDLVPQVMGVGISQIQMKGTYYYNQVNLVPLALTILYIGTEIPLLLSIYGNKLDQRPANSVHMVWLYVLGNH